MTAARGEEYRWSKDTGWREEVNQPRRLRRNGASQEGGKSGD